jgi:transcriptional regulator with XRE-family HTH domain
MEFGIKLRSYRENLGFTQEQFGKKFGFSRTTITELENGSKKPTLKTLEKLSEKTNTKLSYWLDGDQDIHIKAFDGLKTVIDTLNKVGEIDKDGKCSEEGMAMLMKMLEKEIPVYLGIKKN